MLHIHGWRIVALAAAATLGLQLLILALGGNPLIEGRLFDADCYVRIDRVLELMRHGHWFVSLQPRIDAPTGVELNWTRPFDILIMLGAYPLWPILGLKPAIFAWGCLVSPLLFVATLAVLSWGTRRFVTAGQFVVMALLIFLMPRLFGIYEIGRPDHHSLLALIFVAQLALFYRVMAGEERPRYFLLAGAMAGMGLWVSVETLLSLGYFAAVMAVLTVARREYMTHTARYLAGFAGILLVALLLERAPGNWAAPIYSRFSGVHAYLGVAAAAIWAAIAHLGRRYQLDGSRLARTGLIAAAGVLTGVAMLAAYPDFFRGPFVGYDPAIVYDWQAGVVEMSPAWPNSWSAAALFFGNVGPALVALPLLLRLLRGDDPAMARTMALTLAGMTVFLPMTLLQMRWGAYLEPLVLLPLTLTLFAVLRWRAAIHFGKTRLSLASLAAVVVVMGPTFSGGFSASQARTQIAAAPACDWDAAFRYLQTAKLDSWHDSIVFVDEYMGPELAWRTDTRVIASPNIDAGDGIKDVLTVMRTNSADEASTVMARRRIGYVLICRGAPAVEGAFARGLVAGQAPSWLRPIALPETLAPSFQLYRRPA